MRRVLAVSSTLLLAGAVGAGGVADAARFAGPKDKRGLRDALQAELHKTVSPSCIRARISTADASWGSVSFRNTKTCQRRYQAGNGLGVYRKESGEWSLVSSGPCDTGYNLPDVPVRISREFLRAARCQ